jgi:hypothetical protein
MLRSAMRAELRELLSRRSVLQRVLSAPLFMHRRGRVPWLDTLLSHSPVRGLAAAAAPAPVPAASGASLPSASGLVIDVRAAPYGAIGDGVHDDGPALSRALAAFAAASTTHTGVALHLPPGRYRTSQMLRCVGARGGHIGGAGVDQTILHADSGTAGSPAVLQLVNCQFVSCAAMSIWGAGDAPGAAAGWQSFADIGQPAFSPTNNRCSFVSVERCPVGFSTSCAHLLTPVVMTSGAGVSPITVTTATPHGLSTGSVVGILGVRGNAAANTGGSVRVLAPTRFEIAGTGDGAYAGGGTVVWTYMSGGKKDNLSDQNNDGMKFDHCCVRGVSVAAVVIGGENSLVHEFHACDLAGPVGVWLPAGGSFSMYGGSISAAEWDFKVAGRAEHPINVFGTYTESQAGFLLAEPLPPPLSARGLVFNAFGFDKKFGPSVKTAGVARTSGRGVAPITVTTDGPHDLRTGQFVTISDVRGNEAANGTFPVQVLTGTAFTIAATGSGEYERGGRVKSAARLIDLNGIGCYLSLTGCSLAAWSEPGQYVIYCRDIEARGPASRIRLADCELGADEFVVDSFLLIDEQSRWVGAAEGLPRETLLNGAQLVQNSAGHSYSPIHTQYKLGNLRGVRAIGGVGAKPGVNLANVAVLQGSRDGSHSTLAVTFPGGPEIDTNYALVATPTTTTGTPAPNSWRIKSIAKSTRGFVITTEADPGFTGDGPNSVTFDWHLIRWA